MYTAPRKNTFVIVTRLNKDIIIMDVQTLKQLLPQAIGVILTSRTTHIGRCVHLSIAYMKYLRFSPSLVKQCYCTAQRPPFVSILSYSHVLGTTTIHGALLSCGSFFALHIFCVAHFLPVRSATFGTALLRVEGSFLGKC